MTQANYALRLQISLKAEAERVAREEGTTLNQFINTAVAEKLSALRIADYFQVRAKRGNIKKTFAILKRSGRGVPPQEGDEL